MLLAQENLSVLGLADKYELKPILEVCHKRVVCSAFAKWGDGQRGYGQGPYMNIKLKGTEPWWLPDVKASVRSCIDIALQFHTIGLPAASWAFVNHRSHGMLDCWKHAKCAEQREAAAANYNLRLRTTIELLNDGTSGP